MRTLVRHESRRPLHLEGRPAPTPRAGWSPPPRRGLRRVPNRPAAGRRWIGAAPPCPPCPGTRSSASSGASAPTRPPCARAPRFRCP